MLSNNILCDIKRFEGYPQTNELIAQTVNIENLNQRVDTNWLLSMIFDGIKLPARSIVHALLQCQDKNPEQNHDCILIAIRNRELERKQLYYVTKNRTERLSWTGTLCMVSSKLGVNFRSDLDWRNLTIQNNLIQEKFINLFHLEMELLKWLKYTWNLI